MQPTKLFAFSKRQKQPTSVDVGLLAQEGPQRVFVGEAVADIIVYGGAAGGGKSYGLLLRPLRHLAMKGFGALIFRRTMKQVKDEGGLWDTSELVYSAFGGAPNMTERYWTFHDGVTIGFAGLEHEKSKFTFQGSQICVIGFDELTHFTSSQFWYMLSRNRSTCGVRPYVVATTNPGPGWVKQLLAPWVDRKFSGQKAASGEVRWFIREHDKLVWAEPGTPFATSITFIAAKLADNRKLLEKDPTYENKLRAQNEADQRALLHGEWDVELPYRVISSFKESQHVKPIGIPADWVRYIGLDFGLINGAEVCLAEDPTPVMVKGELRKRLIICAENWPGKVRETRDRVKDIREMAGGTPRMCYGGNRTTEQDSRTLLRREGLPVAEPTVKDVAVQYQCVNDEFEDDMLWVSDECQELVGMLLNFQFELDDEGKPTNKFDDAKYHLCAALRYAIVALRPPKRKRTLEVT